MFTDVLELSVITIEGLSRLFSYVLFESFRFLVSNISENHVVDVIWPEYYAYDPVDEYV